MDEFLTKPIELAKLKDALSAYFTGVDEHTANDSGSHQIVQEMISLALRDIPARIEQLKQSYRDGQIAKLSRTAHSLRGIAGSMRLTPLGGITVKIEEASRSNNLEAIPALLAEIDAEWETVEKLLQ